MSADRASSHFIRTGAFTHFAEWCHVQRARLNLLPFNGSATWLPPDCDQRCRTCGYQRETLPHVLCHTCCHTTRHNTVIARIRTAAATNFTVGFENRPVGDTGLRPDLVLVRGEEALVIDVACPFENTPAAFVNTRNLQVRARRRIPPAPLRTRHGGSRHRGSPWRLGPPRTTVCYGGCVLARAHAS